MKDGGGNTVCKVICPITDTFVGYHGALGGFVRVYITGEAKGEQIVEIIRSLPSVEKVWTALGVSEELESLWTPRVISQ